MKYIDYREKLGIGFNDSEIFIALLNKVKIEINNISVAIKNHYYDDLDFSEYFVIISEMPDYEWSCSIEQVYENIKHTNSLNDLISKCVVLINLKSYNWRSSGFNKEFKTFFMKSLNDLNILYEEISDEDGIFIFPRGAEELDYALVSQPLEWLKDYENTRKNYINALKKYSYGDNPNEVAESFRKTLESFFQEFFCSDKSIENLVSQYGNYLKDKGIPKEISNNLQKILELYNQYMNNNIKHHDNANKNALEFIMYQTGSLIRLLITLKEEK